MPTYSVQLNGRTYIVSAEQTSKGGFRATLNNNTFEGQLMGDDRISTWIVHDTKEKVRAKANIATRDRIDVWLAGIPFPATIETSGAANYHLAIVERKHVGGEIRALMPGRVTSILVKEGEDVSAGAPILILEAMKMQNEIVSPVAGRVKSILAQEGTAVKKNTILAEIE